MAHNRTTKQADRRRRLMAVLITLSVPLIAIGSLSAAPPNPMDVAGLSAWYRADNITDGAEPADGAPVQQWCDSSGNGHRLSTSAGHAPTWFAGNEAFGDMPTVRFDGIDDFLATADGDTVTGQTVFLLADFNQTAHNATWISGREDFTLNLQNRRESAPNTWRTGLAPPVAVYRNAATSVATTGSPLEPFTMALSSGAELVVLAADAPATDEFQLARERQWDTFAEGHLAEVIVYDGPVSREDIEGIGEYLRRKYAMPKQPVGRILHKLETRILADKPDRWLGRAVVEKLPNGRMALAYREAGRHPGWVGGMVHIRFSDDGGQTWSAEDHNTDGSPLPGFPVTFSGDDAFEPYLYAAPNNDLILHIWRTNGTSHRHGKGTWQTVSSDGGNTWTEPAQVDFIGVDDDDRAYATDDHTIIDGTIYTSLRQYIGGSQGWQCKFVRSTDNGATWELVNEHINVPELNAVEKGFEYLGAGQIVSVSSHGQREKVLLTETDDLGQTWKPWSDILDSTGVWDRPRIWTLAHLKGEPRWWDDSILLGVGNTTPGRGEKVPRANAVYISTDRGASWWMIDGEPIDGFYPDGGYGDMVYDHLTDTFVYVSYRDGNIVQYRFELNLDAVPEPSAVGLLRFGVTPMLLSRRHGQ